GDDFSHGGHIGRDAAMFLEPAGGDTEAGNDFVENEDHLFFGREFSQPLQKLGAGGADAPMGAVSFVNHAGGLMLVDGAGHGVEVVGRHNVQFAEDAVGYAGDAVVARFVRRLAGRDELVVPAVKMAGKLEDFGASTDDASDAKGHERSLGAAAGEPQLLAR